MCKLTINIDCPHEYDLFIDGKLYLQNDENKYIIELEHCDNHNIKMLISQKNSKQINGFETIISTFKIRNRFYDVFNNLIFNADFSLSSDHKEHKISLKYYEVKTINYEKQEVCIPHLNLLKKKNVKFCNIKESVFYNFKDSLLYTIRHIWLESLICLLILSASLFMIFQTYNTYKHTLDSTLEYVISFAKTPLGLMVEISIFAICVCIWYITRTFSFFKKTKKMMQLSK